MAESSEEKISQITSMIGTRKDSTRIYPKYQSAALTL
jgi:hypothetical protein